MKDEQAEQFEQKFYAVAMMLLAKRDDAIAFRASSGIERMWRLSEKLFDFTGELSTDSPQMIDYAAGIATPTAVKSTSARRSKVTMNVVRGRTETAIGRFCDMYFPVDAKNWGLKCTPNPEISRMQMDQRPAIQGGEPIVDDTGKQAKVADVAADLVSQAESAMALMEREIDDQHVECDYSAEVKKAIFDAGKIGTGVVKGPFVVKTKKRKWLPQRSEDGEIVYTIEEQEKESPASKRVSPWNIFPSSDCEDDPAKSSGIWERDFIRRREVEKLRGTSGYNDDQIAKSVSSQSIRTKSVYDDGTKRHSIQREIDKGDLLELWEGYCDISSKELAVAMGCECDEDEDERIVSVNVVFINDCLVKAQLNLLDTGEFPYDFFQWSTVSDSPWGVGIPFMMLNSQSVINGVWRAMIDNATDSAGANVVIGSDLEPDSGVWEFGKKQIWRAGPECEDVGKLFAQFQIANNQAQLQNIIELTLRFIDLETGTPTIFNGEAQKLPETLGATNIVVDSSNIALRSRVKRFDDNVTKRHLRRYYDWNMQYSEKPEIKGDFEVDPKGLSVLYERDQQAQTLLQVFSLKADPDVRQFTDWKKAISQFYSSKRLDIMKSDADLEQQAQQPPPEQQTAPQPPPNQQLEVAQIRVQGELQKAQLVQQSDMEELRFKAEQAELDRQHAKEMKEMDLQIKMLEYSERRNIELDKLKTQLALGSAGMNLQREMSDRKNVSPQVATPPTEPAGKAPPGEAYQR